MSASVVIALFNAAEHIEAQLRALTRQRTSVAWELILADNGSTDGTLELVHRLAPMIPAPLRVIDASARRGTAFARNTGAHAAAGEWLLFTDQDDVVGDAWIEEMVSALRLNPFVGGRREFRLLNTDEVASWRRWTADTELPLMGDRPYAIGCNFGCRASAFTASGGFNEAFLGGGEDVDLSLRLHAAGMPAVFAERAVVHYRLRDDPRQAVRQLWGYGRATALIYVHHRDVTAPTFLDLWVTCHRNVKQAVRQRLGGRRPVRQAADIAYAVGEASVIWRHPGFWRPVTTRAPLVNPLPVQLERLGRLSGRIFRRP